MSSWNNAQGDEVRASVAFLQPSFGVGERGLEHARLIFERCRASVGGGSAQRVECTSTAGISRRIRRWQSIEAGRGAESSKTMPRAPLLVTPPRSGTSLRGRFSSGGLGSRRDTARSSPAGRLVMSKAASVTHARRQRASRCAAATGGAAVAAHSQQDPGNGDCSEETTDPRSVASSTRRTTGGQAWRLRAAHVVDFVSCRSVERWMGPMRPWWITASRAPLGSITDRSGDWRTPCAHHRWWWCSPAPT